MYFFRWLDESPHWLATNGKTAEALAVLKNMARANRADTDGLSFDPTKFSTEVTEVKEKKAKNGGFVAVLRHKRLMIRFLIFCFGW